LHDRRTPCGQGRLFRRERQVSTRSPRTRRAWTGPNDGAVRVTNTHGWWTTLAGTPLAAAQPGPDELIGVGPVHLGAGRARGGAARLTGDRQEPAGLVHGRIAVDQLAGGPVDVIDAATQQHGCRQPPACRVEPAGVGTVGKSGTPLVVPLRAVDERRQTAARSGECRERVDQRCCAAWEPGLGCLPLWASCLAGAP